DTPMHVGSLMLLEKPRRRGYDFHRDLAAHVTARLPRAPALRRVLTYAPLDLAHPLWMSVDRIEIDAHVVTRSLRAPGSHKQLMNLVAEQHAEPLPRERPLWQFVVIDGLASGQLALYSKIHHALLDGQGGIALAQALLDVEATVSHDPKTAEAAAATSADASSGPSRRDVAQVAARGALNQFARLVRAMPATLRMATAAIGDPRTLVGRIRDAVLVAPRTPFNVQVCAQRRFAIASFPLQQARQVARAFGVSLNDVVLAMCADALRAQLAKRKALPKQSLIAAMPVSLREAGSTESNNQVSMVQCSLATDIADPVERLLAINKASSGIKERVNAFRSLIPTDYPGLAAPLWASGLTRLWARGRVAEKLPPLANLAISNVPGPPIDLYLAGTKLLHYFPISIVTHGLGLNITVQSYAGHLEFGIIACKNVEPNPEAIAKSLAPALAELLARIPA
ncbi:MAG: wax ester/triacylglycerol synthase family O-acyltransferase, partial [Lysobacterales bacterium]